MSCDGCAFCKNAVWSRDNHKSPEAWYVEGCVKGMTAGYNDDTGNHECDGYEEV